MLRDKLQADQTTALKDRNKQMLEVLRFVVARIKAKEIDAKRELSDPEVIEILKKYVRELDEAISAGKTANRPDLVEQNERDKKLIAPYVPVQLSDSELDSEVDRVIAANAQVAQANPKALLGICVKALRTRADSARIVAAVNTKLAK